MPEGIVDSILGDETNPLNRIAHIVPDDARVLDIGAGNGLLARVLLRTHKGLTIDGIEPNPYASELARNSYRHLCVGHAEEYHQEIVEGD
ncbi:MAG: class I SAM-dependent methyltransferase, partial [Anaerolineae bacterium]